MIRSYPHPRYPTHNAPLQLDAGDHREVSHRCPSMLECTHLIRALSFVQVAAVCEAWARADHGVEEEATYSSERSPFFFWFPFPFPFLGRHPNISCYKHTRWACVGTTQTLGVASLGGWFGPVFVRALFSPKRVRPC